MTEQSQTFDSSRYLIKLKGKDYLEVKWRLYWLRTEHPDASIVTSVLEHDRKDGYALIQAAVAIPGGGSATGLGSETKGDFGDYLEKAETKAIGRALAALGYGTQFCDDHDFGAGSKTDYRLVDNPVGRSASPRQPQPSPPPLGDDPDWVAMPSAVSQPALTGSASSFEQAKNTYWVKLKGTALGTIRVNLRERLAGMPEGERAILITQYAGGRRSPDWSMDDCVALMAAADQLVVGGSGARLVNIGLKEQLWQVRSLPEPSTDITIGSITVETNEVKRRFEVERAILEGCSNGNRD